MIRKLIFLIISIIAGIACYFLAWQYLPKIHFLYNPFNWLFQTIYKIYPLSSNWFTIIVSSVIGIILFLALIIIDKLTEEKPLTSRGSARWANNEELKELMIKKGVPIGKVDSFGGKFLYETNSNLVTCAPTRTGKGVGAIIPTLLEYPESLVCLDIKGENYAVTARRRKDFGACYAINPFGVLDIKSSSFNWLDTINIDDPNCTDNALKLASQLVGDNNKNSIDEHFNTQAIRLLQGVILAVCTEKENRNICTVSELIHHLKLSDLCDYLKSKGNAAFNLISSVADQFANNKSENETSGILSTAQRATNFLDNPNIKNTLLKSDFDISRLPDEIMSIYLILQQDKISAYRTYARIFFDLTFSSIISRQKRGKYDVLFLLDEVSQLGYMKNFADQISFIRGMGGQLWFFFQNYQQLTSIYGKDAGTILGNATQIFYGCNDYETAELISKTLGKKTGKEPGKNGDYNYISQDLASPDEIMHFSKKHAIIKMSGIHPIKAKKLDYRKDKKYRGLFDENPLHRRGKK